MPNKTTPEGIIDLRQELLSKKSELANKIRLIDDQLKAVNMTLELLGVGRFQASVQETVKNIPDLGGMTQHAAIAALARANGGHIKATTARMVLLKQGLIKNPKNALSIVYGVLQRHEELFRKVSPGVYELISAEQLTSEVANGKTPKEVVARLVSVS